MKLINDVLILKYPAIFVLQMDECILKIGDKLRKLREEKGYINS